MSYTNVNSGNSFPLFQYLSDLGRYRHLCWNLVASDLRSRFRRSRIGILWAVLQPLAFALIIAYVWGQVFQQASYWTFALYVFSGMVLWEFFSTSVNVGLDALINAHGYLKQARIPFLIFQLRQVLTAIVIFMAGIIGIVTMITALRVWPPLGLHLLLLPAFVGVLLVFGLPLTIAFSILGTKFRDIRYVTQILLQAVFFVSPVFLDRAFIESPHIWLLKYLNPFVSLAELFRGPLLYGQLWKLETMIIMAVWIGVAWLLALILVVRAGRRIIYAL
jgi:lipopolysaccharide transport system permease protein